MYASDRAYTDYNRDMFDLCGGKYDMTQFTEREREAMKELDKRLLQASEALRELRAAIVENM